MRRKRIWLAPQNVRLTAVALTGAIDAAILSLLSRAERADEAPVFTRELNRFVLRAAAYLGGRSRASLQFISVIRGSARFNTR